MSTDIATPAAESLNDPLAACLAQVARLLGQPMSAEALVMGLPIDAAGLTPALFARAAERAGLSARSIAIALERFPKLSLPAVLLLKDRNACVLVARGESIATIVTAEGVDKTLPTAELAKDYEGTAIAVSRAVRFEAGTGSERILATHHWFWGTLARAWPLYGEVACASVLVNVFTVLSPIFFMNVYDRVVPNKAFETFWVLALGMAAIYLFDFGLKLLRGWFIDVAGRRADMALSSALFEQVMARRLDAGHESVGMLANNVREFESLREFFTSATMTTLIDLPFVLLFIAVIAMVGGWSMAAVPLIAIPVVVARGVALQVPLRDRIRRVFRASEAKHAILIETLGAIEAVKALGAASQMQRKWEEVVDYVAKESLGTRFLSSLAVNFSAWVQAMVGIATLAVGVYLVGDNHLTTGALIACTIIAGRALAPLSTVASLLTRYHQSMSALAALNQIMDAPRERPRDRSVVHRPALGGDIRFQDVAFKYPGSELDALAGVSFAIKEGDRVGIIGRIGSGKTTLAKLLVALYQPQRGSILVDGTDIRAIDPADLRRAVGYLPQNIALFAGSVRDNLLVGAAGADDAAILRAASVAGLIDIVNRHPKGFDMPVGERGEALSGGQRQTVALARALITDPPILVLDEPTHAMDHSAEERLKTQMQTELAGKTIIVVTHRESLLSVVNTLVVMDSGKVVAAGPKELVLKAIAEGKVRTAR
ncbi:MAG: type I secretion system permease/ATPase [Betaproteobacteria bacterium]|nr:type I secretion system permease/ATPase [Betaproteobacteria bacterium]